MGDSSLVYSTDTGATCPECEKSIDQCSLNPSANRKDRLMIVRISSTNKERKVEDVTIIERLRIKPKYL